MIDRIRTVQGVAAIVAAIFATMVARWNLGLPRLVFTPELTQIHRRIEALEQLNRDTGSWCSTRPGGAPIRSACSGRRWTHVS